MSYSFSKRASTKEALNAEVADEFAKIVAAQPVHAADQVEVLEAVDAFADLLEDDETRDYSLSISGSVHSTDQGLQQVNCSITVGLAPRT